MGGDEGQISELYSEIDRLRRELEHQLRMFDSLNKKVKAMKADNENFIM